MSGPVSLAVGVGGTFTDVVLFADGVLTTAKVPTTEDQHRGVLDGIDLACERAGVDPAAIGQFRHATTVATNALLEGEGAETALVTTAGFADILEIGRQDRPSLYDPTVRRPDPLVPVERRYEVDERATPDGIESEPADLGSLVEQVAGNDGNSAAEDEGSDAKDELEAVAVSLLHAYDHPDNERAVVAALDEALDVPVVASHRTLAEFREYERTATTAADAAVTPLVRSYLDRLAAATAERGIAPPQVMQSNGGIADVGTVRDRAVTTMLSGPAAGVVGATMFAGENHEGTVTFDMGGTSCDVGLVRNGTIERTTEGAVGGHPVRTPMVDVNTVGAGGGSIAWVDDGGALRVGPESAGANPGPACYGRGGTEPTVTDAAVVLGHLGSDTTLGADLALDGRRAREVLSALGETADLDGPVAAARGIRRVATERLSGAIRRVTLERGHDPRGFDLVAFGGAGPMYATAVADSLGVTAVRVPKASGVLSALGLLAADERHDASRTHRSSLDALEISEATSLLGDLVAQVRSAASEPARATVQRRADLRYAGQQYELTVSLPETVDRETVAERFHAAHERVRGYRLPGESIELVTLRATAVVAGEEPAITHEGTTREPRTWREASVGDRFREVPVYDREGLPVGTSLDGPAICEGGESTVVVPPDWTGDVDERGTLELERVPGGSQEVSG